MKGLREGVAWLLKNCALVVLGTSATGIFMIILIVKEVCPCESFVPHTQATDTRAYQVPGRYHAVVTAAYYADLATGAIG